MDRLLCEDRVHILSSSARGHPGRASESLVWAAAFTMASIPAGHLPNGPTSPCLADATLRLADAAGTVLGTPYTRTAKPTIASTASAHRRNPSLWGQGEPVFTCDSGVARWHRPVAPAPWFKCSRLDCQLFWYLTRVHFFEWSTSFDLHRTSPYDQSRTAKTKRLRILLEYSVLEVSCSSFFSQPMADPLALQTTNTGPNHRPPPSPRCQWAVLVALVHT